LKEQISDDHLIRQYLLGELSLEETDRLDQLVFTDEEFAIRLQVVENDLVDAYARGHLEEPALRRFTSVYLSSPARRDKVKFAQALFKISPAPQPKRSGLQSWFSFPALAWQTAALATAALLLLFTTSWLALENRRLRAERSIPASPREPVQEKQSVEDRLPNFVALNLLPPTRGVRRLQTLVIPADADFVSLQAELESGQYSEYRTELRLLPQRELLSKRSSLRNPAITLRAATLQPGTYVLDVFGVTIKGKEESVGSYLFKITRR
jgi:hypothetical protein